MMVVVDLMVILWWLVVVDSDLMVADSNDW